MFCTNCGYEVEDNVAFCTNCGARLIQDQYRKNKKSIAVPIFITMILVLIVGVIGAGAYCVTKTNEFKEEIAGFEEDAKKFPSLGKYRNTYDNILSSAYDVSSVYSVHKYEDIKKQMSDLITEVDSMNRAVEKYREQYEEAIVEIETDSKFIMTDYEEDYQEAKESIEESLEEFDEKACKKDIKKLLDVCDSIVKGNEQLAESYINDVENITNDFSNYNLCSFESYMLRELGNAVTLDDGNIDYIKLQEDYNAFKEWADKFNKAISSNFKVDSFVQADVSAGDLVKIYLSLNDYSEYNFKLEDFVIYEQNNNVWEECHAESMNQIDGMLTMDIVADISGSMDYNFYDMQCAIDGFVSQTYADTQLGLSTIGSIYERYQGFTTDKNAIKNAVWDLECYGLTSLYQSLYSSVVYTASEEGARCVVAFTDGINEPYGAGYDYDAQDVIDVAQYYQVPVYIIGIGDYLDASALRTIAESTGGMYFDNMSVYDLQKLYMDIYNKQGQLYELAYKTQVSNDVDRELYVLYADEKLDLSVRIDSKVNAEALQNAYESAGLLGNDLPAFYTDSKYLSSDDLAKLGDDLEAVQTVINIYYAKNGYQFGDGDNGQKQLAKMINLGVISQNGTLDGDEVTEILRADPVLWQNFSALYNYRYELVYSAALDIFRNDPYISYGELRKQVSEYYGEENEMRYDPVVSSAWKNITKQ